MGEIRTYRCECGYTQKLFEGGGILSANPILIEKLFPEKIKEFQSLKESGLLHHFCVTHKPYICTSCQELMTIPVLLYEVKGQEEKEYTRKLCPKCAKSLFLPRYSGAPGSGKSHSPAPSAKIICPKCQQPMEVQLTGHWD